MNTGKILITGATGDTGGYAIEQLLQKGHEVRALVHRIDDRSKRLEDRRVGGTAQILAISCSKPCLPQSGHSASGLIITGCSRDMVTKKTFVIFD
jgi:nucleoside-diphosphate-sugar epimerase